MDNARTLLVGIDCGEKQYDVCAIQQNSRFRSNFSTGITRSDREKISRRICEVASKTVATEVAISVECSTPTSHILTDYLTNYQWPDKFKVSTKLLPTPTPRFLARAGLVETKTDRIDAYTCAQCGQFADVPHVKRTSEELKAYAAEYILFTKHIAATKQHMRSILLALNPALVAGVPTLHKGALLRVIIDCFIVYRREKRLDIASLKDILANRRFRMKIARREFLLQTIAQETIDGKLYLVDSLERLHDVLTVQEISVRKTKEEIVKIAGQSKIVKLLTTIAGIGDFTAGVVAGVIQDIGRFESVNKLVGYIGTYPVIAESCGKGRKSEMSHKGVKILKKLMWTSAMTAVNTNQHVQNIFRKAVSRGLTKKAAYGVIMTRLVRWIFGVWKSGESWKHAKKEQVGQNQPQTCKSRKNRGQDLSNDCSSPVRVDTNITRWGEESKKNHQSSP